MEKKFQVLCMKRREVFHKHLQKLTDQKRELLAVIIVTKKKIALYDALLPDNKRM